APPVGPAAFTWMLTPGAAPTGFVLAASGGPAIGVPASPFAFPNQTMGTTSAPLSLTLMNSGNAVLVINSFLPLTGSNPGDFALVAGGGTCGPVPITLAAGASCTVQFTFTPSTTTAESATLTVSGTGLNSPQVVTLTGMGTPPPAPAVGPLAPVAFGNQPENTTSAAMTATLTNTGTAALNFTSAPDITGANLSDFAITGGTCAVGTPVAANGGVCTVAVTFK